MSILRPACYKKFAPVIDEMYARFEGHGSGRAPPKVQANTQGEMEEFLAKILDKVLASTTKKGHLGLDTDLFEYGVDSLQAGTARNLIVKGVELGTNGARLGQNIVYEYPTIRQLAAYLLDLKKSGEEASQGGTSESKDNADETAANERLMWDLVDKFSSQVLPPASAPGTVKDNTAQISKEAQGETVVLTGATGSLGAHLVDHLTRQPAIARVICLSRAASDAESLQRLRASLQQRKRTLTPAAWAKVVSFAADVNLSKQLGLASAAVYDMIRAEATAIVHNAWPVNFNMSLRSFEPHIEGAVNLVNLAQTSAREVRPTVFFSSSVSTVQAAGGRFVGGVCPEGFMGEAGTAAGIGYGRSKWVVEKILERAAEEKGTRVGVLRIGQLVGDDEK